MLQNIRCAIPFIMGCLWPQLCIFTPMTRMIPIFALFFQLVSCQELDRFVSKDNTTDTTERPRTYSYACLDSAVSGNRVNRTLGRAGDLIRDIAVNEDKITDEVQSEYGATFHQQMVVEQKEFVLLKDAAVQGRLQTALDKLLAVRTRPSKIDYHIYALKDTAINAFTFGGRIYVTQGMLRKIGNNTSLLYAIVGHEIGHSEEGHIRKTIQDLQLTNNIFGEANAGFALQVMKLITASFNQKNELEADYYGVELTHRLQQEVCSAVKFWREMASNENRYSQVEDFFRTHPFSGLRAQCLEDHIMANFGTSCGENRKGVLPQVEEKPVLK